MNSLIETLGTFGNSVGSNPLYLLLGLLILIIIILAVFVFLLSRKLSRFMRGKHALSLEEVMTGIGDDIQKIKAWQKTANDLFAELDSRVTSSIRGTSLIRFNPFKGTGDGGNQSFSAAFVNEEGEGVVLSSLYSRERVSIFGKPIVKFSSTFELTEEEKQAVKKAKETL